MKYLRVKRGCVTDLRPVRRGVTSIQGRWPCCGLRPHRPTFYRVSRSLWMRIIWEKDKKNGLTILLSNSIVNPKLFDKSKKDFSLYALQR